MSAVKGLLLVSHGETAIDVISYAAQIAWLDHS